MGDQRECIDLMADPATHGVLPGDVQRIETHAAIVFLAGDVAYKMKRAVAYPYLDFSSLHLRETALRHELNLNRRTAPGLYLRVVPITREAGGMLVLNGSGEPIEWLLVMRRFRQDTLFTQLAADGHLDLATMYALADRIAAFHDDAQIIRSISPLGGMAAVLEIDRRGFAASETTFPADTDRALHYQKRAEGTAIRLAGLLNDRREHGHVRHCHGDLHLGNICLFDGAPTLFDCIEFDDSLAEIDVLYDLAFLLMDLEHRDLRGQANAVFNRYLDRRDEDSGIALLPFFLSTRAAVRSHVGFTTAIASGDTELRERRADEARTYLALAKTLLAGKVPRLMAVGGLSGSGKSTLAGALAPFLGACPGARIVRSDVERKRLMNVPPEVKLPESAYTPDIGRKVYDIMADRAERVLEAGHSVILDAVFARQNERDRVGNMARRLGVAFSGIWLDAPAASMRQRIATRVRDASDATPAVLDRQLGYDLGTIDWNRIPSANAIKAVVARARALIPN